MKADSQLLVYLYDLLFELWHGKVTRYALGDRLQEVIKQIVVIVELEQQNKPKGKADE